MRPLALCEETRRHCRENLQQKLKHVEQSVNQLWGRVGARRSDIRSTD